MAAMAPIALKCPACDEVIDVPLTIRTGDVVDGNLNLDVDPDLSDVWLHTWTAHDINPPED